MYRREREGGRGVNSSRMAVVNYCAVATVDIVKLEG